MNESKTKEEEWITLAELMAELKGVPPDEVYVKDYNNNEDKNEQQQSNVE
jgi:hypothetical protein